jgi:DNA-binding XRE family transcriptional regulator
VFTWVAANKAQPLGAQLMSNEAGNRIRKLREAAGFNQTEVATGINLTRRELATIESGRIEAAPRVYAEIEQAIIRLSDHRSKRVGQMASMPEMSAIA